MQNEKQDILYRAAAVWKELTGYHYRLTYGYKGELHQINLTFAPEDFPHLAGFHYLKDLALPRYNPRKTVDMILSGKITHETVRKGAQYRELVEPRLMALVRLKEILEQDFDLFSYVPRFYPFVTKIKADYLISSQGEPKHLTRSFCTTVCQRISNNERCPPACGENHRSVGIVFFMGCA